MFLSLAVCSDSLFKCHHHCALFCSCKAAMLLWPNGWNLEDFLQTLQLHAPGWRVEAQYALAILLTAVTIAGIYRSLRRTREPLAGSLQGPDPSPSSNAALDAALQAFKELVQSLSDKVQSKLAAMMGTLEDKLEAITTLPPLVQQMAAMEENVKKLPAITKAVGTIAKWDPETNSTALAAVKQAVENSFAATKDTVMASLKELFAGHWKQMQERFTAARETASEHFQKLQASNAEGNAVLKSHTQLLTAFRTKIQELEDVITGYRKHVDELGGYLQSNYRMACRKLSTDWKGSLSLCRSCERASRRGPHTELRQYLLARARLVFRSASTSCCPQQVHLVVSLLCTLLPTPCTT